MEEYDKNVRQGTTLAFLDRNVFLTLGFVLLLALAILSFKYFTRVECKEFSFYTSEDKLYVHKAITFKLSEIDSADKVEWNFGDSSENAIKNSMGNDIVLYRFGKAGKYRVNVTVNGSCFYQEEVIVYNREKVLDSTKIPRVVLPREIIVGEEVTFTDETIDGEKWEWRFGESAKIDSRNQIANYTYKESGLKTITLIVNDRGNEYMYIQKVYVKNKKEEEVPLIPEIGKPKSTPFNIPDIPDAPPEKVTCRDEDFIKKKLIALSKGSITYNDFKIYLCNKDADAFEIMDNGTKDDFKQFMKTLILKKPDKKKVVISKLKLKWDKPGECEDKCITDMEINYKIKNK